MESIRRCDQPDLSGGVMGVIKKHQTHDLPEWLGIVTKNLVVSAKERICAEIEEHYAETVASHLTEGLSKADAMSQALAELGDPEEAAKRFCRLYMTIGDVRRLKNCIVSSPTILCISILFTIIILSVLKWSLHHEAVLMCISCVCFLPTPINAIASFIMARHKSKNIGFIFFVMAMEFGFLCILIFINFRSVLIVGLPRDPDVIPGFPGLSNLIPGFLLILVSTSAEISLIYAFLRDFRIWLKLRHVSNVWNEITLLND
jgi:hypothetical protein